MTDHRAEAEDRLKQAVAFHYRPDSKELAGLVPALIGIGLALLAGPRCDRLHVGESPPGFAGDTPTYRETVPDQPPPVSPSEG